MYGRGGVPPPPTPPVPHERDSQATSLPSLSAAIFTRAKADGRMPATSNSALRSSRFFTGLPPAFLESLAVLTSQRSTENLLPNPPPTFCCSTLCCRLEHWSARPFARRCPRR